MEFELSMYRVHERTLQGPADDATQRGCLALERTCCLLTLLFTALTILGHVTVIGNGSCVQMAMEAANVPNAIAELKGEGDNGTGLLRTSLLRISLNLDSGSQSSLERAAAEQVADAASSNGGEFDAAFEFVVSPSLIDVPDELRKRFGMPVLNISLPVFCGGQDSFTASIVGMSVSDDTFVINQLMYSLRSSGYLKNLMTGEVWAWPAGITDSENYVLQRIVALIASLLAFAVLSGTTSIMVRVFVVSGVGIVFPMWYCLNACGARVISRTVLSMSYPWIGTHVEVYRRQRRSSAPLIAAHLIALIVVYMMYESVQASFAFWFFQKSSPMAFALGLFAVMMAWEYGSLVFVRTKPAIIIWPRVCLATFLLLMFYFYLTPYGVTLLATNLAFFSSAYLFVRMIRTYELPALRRGEISAERSRSLVNALPMPSVPWELPGLWTLFLPLNSAARGLYDREVPPVPGAPSGAGSPPGVAASSGEPVHDRGRTDSLVHVSPAESGSGPQHGGAPDTSVAVLSGAAGSAELDRPLLV